MAADLAITPASGSITAKETVCRIDLTGADDVDLAQYDAEDTPSAPPITYVITAEKAGFGETLQSVVFTPSSDGKWTWDNLVFPEDGSWSVKLLKTSDLESAIDTLAVTVS